MPYFPVDDDMPFHPKVLAAGNEAMGLWARAGALCKKYATGGEVSTEMVLSLGTKRLADRLVKAGLWVVIDGGYRFHDWKQQAGNDEASVEKERIDRARAKNAARQKAWRERHASDNGVTNAPVTESPSPSPSPSDLTLTNESRPEVDASVSTDSGDLSPAMQALASQAGITSVPAVVEQIRKWTQRDVTPDVAVGIARHLLAKSKGDLKWPQRYVARAISQSPLEVQQHIDEGGLAA
ncbi:hypothetical protein [Agromyces ramosus]|uniref:Helix-turn-helix DNA binding domain protein n=1 Tax=Agromyces ramosus TaxID=33879 RepID=A0ABU0R8Q6_9MICO|nr:hypothetical protein [Agromyces ramosus]MDQ0894449.1 hypothetical protein [Agromyces ramosus]